MFRVSSPISGEFGEGAGAFVGVGRFAMPFVVTGHEGDTLAFNRMRHDADRLAGHGVCFRERLENRFDIMTVDLDDVPAEGRPFLGYGLPVEDLADRSIELAFIVVQDGHQVIQLVRGSAHGGFPHLAFFAFAIAEHHVDAVVGVVELARQRHAYAHGQPLPERAGGGFHKGTIRLGGMTLQRAAEFAQCFELFDGQIARFRQRGVEDRHRVTFAHDEAITPRVVRIGRILAQDTADIERREQFRRGQRSTGVSGFGGGDHLHHMAAEYGGLFVESLQREAKGWHNHEPNFSFAEAHHTGDQQARPPQNRHSIADIGHCAYCSPLFSSLKVLSHTWRIGNERSPSLFNTGDALRTRTIRQYGKGQFLMALLHINYFSSALQKHSAMYVVLPETEPPFRVVYQLHGFSDDYTIWLRRTSIERYADDLKLMVVMLDGGHSFFCDMKSATGNYEQHILESVRFIDKTFHTDARPEGRGIGGLSMGGYGTMKLGLKYPDLFGSVASHSGALDMATMYKERFWPEFKAIFGDNVDPEDDCFALAMKDGKKPAIYFDCGTEDSLIANNRAFHDLLTNRQIPHTYQEFPGGHSWAYWDEHITAALQFHCHHFGARVDATSTRD